MDFVPGSRSFTGIMTLAVVASGITNQGFNQSIVHVSVFVCVSVEKGKRMKKERACAARGPFVKVLPRIPPMMMGGSAERLRAPMRVLQAGDAVGLTGTPPQGLTLTWRDVNVYARSHSGFFRRRTTQRRLVSDGEPSNYSTAKLLRSAGLIQARIHGEGNEGNFSP